MIWPLQGPAMNVRSRHSLSSNVHMLLGSIREPENTTWDITSNASNVFMPPTRHLPQPRNMYPLARHCLVIQTHWQITWHQIPWMNLQMTRNALSRSTHPSRHSP